MRKLLITLALLASTSIPAMAGDSPGEATLPSFNCSYAKLPAEVMICKDELLSMLDDSNAKVFYMVRNELKDRKSSAVPAFNKQERAWLKDRNDCGYDADCINSSYRNHLRDNCKLAYKLKMDPWDKSGAGSELSQACRNSGDEEIDDSAITGCGKDVDCD